MLQEQERAALDAAIKEAQECKDTGACAAAWDAVSAANHTQQLHGLD